LVLVTIVTILANFEATKYLLQNEKVQNRIQMGCNYVDYIFGVDDIRKTIGFP